MELKAEQEQPDLSPGTRLGRYEIRKALGQGGMGAVYEAVHIGLDKPVALKTLHEDVSHDSTFVTRFLREGKVASRIRHPHIVDVTDVDAIEGRPFLVMELLQGEDLGRLIARKGHLSVEETLDVMLPALAAVVAAHDTDIIHRDLKPENIFVTEGPQGEPFPKILDFGISKAIDPKGQPGMTGTKTILGTPYYMAPEQFDGSRKATARSDQYAMGVIVYECLTGQRPYDAESFVQLLSAIGSGHCQAPRELQPDLPPQLEAAVLKAMRVDAAGRFPTLRDFGRALLPFASERARERWSEELADASYKTFVSPHAETIPSDPPSRAPTPVESADTLAHEARERPDTQTPLPSRRRTGLVAGALALLAAIGVVGWIAANGLGGDEQADEPSDDTGAAAQPGQAQDESATDEPDAPAGEQAGESPEKAGGGAEGGAEPEGGSSETEPQTYRVQVEVRPRRAVLVLDGERVGRGELDRELPRDGEEHTLRVRARGYAERVLSFRDAPPDSPIRLRRLRQGGGGQQQETGEPDEQPGEQPADPEPRKGANEAPILE